MQQGAAVMCMLLKVCMLQSAGSCEWLGTTVCLGLRAGVLEGNVGTRASG